MAVPIVARPAGWLPATRQSDGLAFWIVPASRGQAVYYTTAEHCTCPDSRHRGRVCKHSRQAQELDRAARQVAGAEHQPTASPTSWRPCSRGCGELLSPEHVGKSCDACWSKLAATLDFLEG